MDRRVYLDHQATTPTDPLVVEAMLPYFTDIFGNAASIDHEYGNDAARAVATGRAAVAALVGCDAEELLITSGSTEANNLAIMGTLGKDPAGRHIIYGATEHPSVRDTATAAADLGAHAIPLRVDRYGVADPDELRKALRPETAIVSIMLANNEIGSIAPIKELARVTHQYSDALFHTDATQAVGHINVDVRDLGVDLLSFSAHKFYGPKGIGGLFVRSAPPRVRLRPILWGGGHERGMRSGTINVPGVVGLGRAAELARTIIPREQNRVRQLRDTLQERLGILEPAWVNGHPLSRLPHNLSVTFPGVEGKALIVAAKQIAFSTGSACSTAKVEPSHVLLAIGLSETDAHCSIRFGLGRSTDGDEIQFAGDVITEAVTRLRRLSGTRVASSRTRS